MRNNNSNHLINQTLHLEVSHSVSPDDTLLEVEFLLNSLEGK